MASEISKLRAAQTRKVMPLIGPLLDAWEMVDNDFKGTIRDHEPTLADYLDRINAAIEG
jgi:hypothetical protein